MLRFPYRVGLPSRRWRPFAPIRLLGPTGAFRDFPYAVLDTGSDDTAFPLGAAVGLGVVPEARLHSVRWRGQVYQLRFGTVELALRDGTSVWRWPARVGFTTASIGYPLLGQSGVLQFFDAEFLGALRTAQLNVNGSHPGIISWHNAVHVSKPALRPCFRPFRHSTWDERRFFLAAGGANL